MPDLEGARPLATYISVKHGLAFEGRYFCDEPTIHVLVTPGNFAIGGGFQEGKAKYYAGPIPQDYILCGGDLVVTMTDLSKAGDTLGYPALIPITNGRVYLHNQRIGLVSILAPDKLDRGYLYYLLCSDAYRNHILATASGSTVRHTSPTRICDFLVELPPLKEQQATAETLRALDDKIEHNRRTATALKGLAQATFKAWFVDFEPVKAKAAGQTSFPGMPSSAFVALPDRLKDSSLGPVPQGWAVRPLKETVKLTMGQSPSSEFYNFTGDGLPFHQGVSDHGFRFPTRRVYCTTDGRIADAGDVLLSVRAPVGRINVADVRMVLGRGLAGMRHKQNKQSFLLYLMQHHFAEDDAVGDGTIYRSVNKDFVEAMPLIEPPPETLQAFENIAAPIDAMISSLTKESSKLAALRDYLLPRLLSGRVRVQAFQVEKA